MSLALDLSGRLAVVTGGTRGVGGIARAFLQAGAEVVVCARRPPDAPVTAALPPGALPRPRPARRGRRTRLLRPTRLRLRPVGLSRQQRGRHALPAAGEADAARHARVVELNLLAPLTASLAAYEVMRDRPGGGSVLMIGSVSGTRPSPGTAAYGAAKAGLDHLARSMAVEWAPKVRVNTLVLGMVRTELAALHYGDEAGIAAVGATVPLEPARRTRRDRRRLRLPRLRPRRVSDRRESARPRRRGAPRLPRRRHRQPPHRARRHEGHLT